MMIDKILSKIGMWFHKFKHEPSYYPYMFTDIGPQARVVMECQVCSRIWAWDRKRKPV